MPKTVVCTGWHPAGWKQYGEQFLTTFNRHWPRDIGLWCFTEEAAPDVPERDRAQWQDIGQCDELVPFIARHAGNPAANGRKPDHRWRDKERAARYTYRFDAVKFSKQMFIPEAVAWNMHNGDILVWLDADVVTFKDVPTGFVEGLLGDADLVHLGRKPHHSEIGFWAVRLNTATRQFLVSIADIYRSDAVFKLAEWHSAFVFDHVLAGMVAQQRIKARDLTPGCRGHVWFQSPLCKYTDHLKGNRKAAGRSVERRR